MTLFVRPGERVHFSQKQSTLHIKEGKLYTNKDYGFQRGSVPREAVWNWSSAYRDGEGIHKESTWNTHCSTAWPNGRSNLDVESA